MHPKKSRKPFVLYLKATRSGAVWYAKFWNEAESKFTVTRSTAIYAEGKKQRRYEAEQAARTMLPEMDFKPPAPEKSFIEYLYGFWSPDSAYVRECALIKKRPLSAYYIRMNHEDVSRHIESYPAFQEITLQRLTPAKMRDWLLWMAGKGLSGHRVNHVLLAIRVAVRYAVDREEVERDPLRGVKEVTENPREKGILTPSEVYRLINAPIADPKARLVVLLGVLCGMRRGEIRGLQWGDIEDGLIRIRHNWIDGEGMKVPKCKGGTIRENSRIVPLPGPVSAVLETVKGTSRNPAPDRFVIEGVKNPDGPISNNFFRYSLENELEAIGIPGPWRGKEQTPDGYVDEQRHRNLTLHGLRHTYITLGRLAGREKIEGLVNTKIKTG
jgi:integrase